MMPPSNTSMPSAPSSRSRPGLVGDARDARRQAARHGRQLERARQLGHGDALDAALELAVPAGLTFCQAQFVDQQAAVEQRRDEARHPRLVAVDFQAAD
jgi:hypothetical protein